MGKFLEDKQPFLSSFFTKTTVLCLGLLLLDKYILNLGVSPQFFSKIALVSLFLYFLANLETVLTAFNPPAKFILGKIKNFEKSIFKIKSVFEFTTILFIMFFLIFILTIFLEGLTWQGSLYKHFSIKPSQILFFVIFFGLFHLSGVFAGFRIPVTIIFPVKLFSKTILFWTSLGFLTQFLDKPEITLYFLKEYNFRWDLFLNSIFLIIKFLFLVFLSYLALFFVTDKEKQKGLSKIFPPLVERIKAFSEGRCFFFFIWLFAAAYFYEKLEMEIAEKLIFSLLSSAIIVALGLKTKFGQKT